MKSKVLFQCCSGIMWPCGMLSIYLVRKGQYDWSLHEGLLLDWIIFLLYLLQFLGCSKCSAKNIFISYKGLSWNISGFLLWNPILISLLSWQRILLVLSSGILLAWFSSGVTLLFEHLPIWTNEIEHFVIFSYSKENQLVRRFSKKFNLLLFFLIS